MRSYEEIRQEEMRNCRDKGWTCDYGICDECPVTRNPSIVDEEDDADFIPKEVVKHFNIEKEREM